VLVNVQVLEQTGKYTGQRFSYKTGKSHHSYSGTRLVFAAQTKPYGHYILYNIMASATYA
jgi:hypothetical protein